MILWNNDIKLPRARIFSTNIAFDSAVLCATPVSAYLRKLREILARI